MHVLVTGGAGYVGSLLVPALLARDHQVTVLDWFLYGETLEPHENLHLMRCDLREINNSHTCVIDQEAVIHLACISNDPSFELDPELGKSINYHATVQLVHRAKRVGVKRFIYASSSSVYGVKPDGVEVTEDLPLEPLTDYSKYKAMGEEVVLAANSPAFTATVLRPATLCGYAPRLRLDLIVNLLTNQAYHAKVIPVIGGSQRRPNLHIADMVAAYINVLEAPTEQVAGEVFNVGDVNSTVLELAELVQLVVGGDITVTAGTNDPRSYAVNTDKIRWVLGFAPRHSILGAIRDLVDAFKAGKVPNALTDPRYYNIKQMQTCHIS